MDTVEVLLLGPVAVRAGADAPTPVAGAKLRRLVALLALAAPRPVSDDRLLEALWGDGQPARPANALQAQVSALRRLLSSETVVREGLGYALRVPRDAVDANRLGDLVQVGQRAAAEGDHAAADDRFGEAIALVRGPPLEDLPDAAFAREAAAGFDELVVLAHEGRIDAALASGRHAEVVPLLTDLVQAHPLRERFHEQRILALFRCGRQADALRAYQEVRRTLADELGLEPGPGLRALEQAVLTQDPSLVAPIPLTPTWEAPQFPAPLTSFVGRTGELAALADAVAASRLVTVLGPAGAGKTRLIVEWVWSLEPTRERWFVDLTPVDAGRGVAHAVASAVGAVDLARSGPGAPEARIEDRIVARLRDRDAVVVIDNVEQTVDDVRALVTEVLQRCPRLRVVATSRFALGIDGEHHLSLGPLDDADAVDLFTARSAAVGAAGEGRDAVGLAELCRRLDGLPLAIELAAARTRALTVAEITNRLVDRFGLLGGLGAAIGWSYDLLFDEEQVAFGRLAVFAGGATIDAAEAVCGPDALDVVTRLADKSMVAIDTSGATSRIRMLESLRAYGQGRLEDDGEWDRSRADHLAWCLTLAEQAEQGIRGDGQVEWLDRLDADHDNLVAGLAFAADHDPAVGLRLIAAVALPWWFRGRGVEARRWLDELLGAGEDAPMAVRVGALTWSGLFADFGEAGRPFAEELQRAEVRQREAVTAAAAIGDLQLLAHARSQLALTLTRQAIGGHPVDQEEVADLRAAAVAAFEDLGDDFGAGQTRLMEAVACLAAGDGRRAEQATTAATRHAHACGDRYVLGRVAWVRGTVAGTQGRIDDAYRHIEVGIRLLDELGMGQEVTSQAMLLADLAERRGNRTLALQWRAFSSGRSGGLARHDVLLTAAARNADGLRARAAGDLDDALAAHDEALAAARTAGVSSAIAHTESCLGFLLEETGDVAGAAAHHRAALEAAVASGEPAAIGLGLAGVAGLAEGAEAATLLGAAVAMAGDRLGRDAATVAARVRARLEPTVFEPAWAHGAAMSLDDALVLARAKR